LAEFEKGMVVRLLIWMAMKTMVGYPLLLLSLEIYLHWVGYDEVIYPVDFKRAGHIVDDDMHNIM